MEKFMEFMAFLLRAKLKTYATRGEGNERNLDDGTRQMSYREGDFFYRDRYFGFNPFVGEEVVWEKDKVIWAMNYYGGMTDESISAGDVYHFLQKAMQQITAARPFRGPNEYREGEFRYQDQSEGSIDQFSGEEKIFFRDMQVYFLKYHGGKVG
jgi:hypothetical protein